MILFRIMRSLRADGLILTVKKGINRLRRRGIVERPCAERSWRGRIEFVPSTGATDCRVIQISDTLDPPAQGVDGRVLENLPLRDWAFLFRQAHMVIGVDSWAAHFASIINVDQVIVYGPTVTSRWEASATSKTRRGGG